MTGTATTETRTISAQIRFGIVLAVLAALLVAGQTDTSARGNGEPPVDPPGKDQPGNKPGDGNSLNEDPADHGNGLSEDPADNGNGLSEDPADNGNGLSEDPADNGNGLSEDPADNGNGLNEDPGEDEEKPGTITAPIVFDITTGQSRPEPATGDIADSRNTDRLANALHLR